MKNFQYISRSAKFRNDIGGECFHGQDAPSAPRCLQKSGKNNMISVENCEKVCYITSPVQQQTFRSLPR